MSKTTPSTAFPFLFEDERHEALIRTWHSGQLLRLAATRFFADKPISETQFNLLAGLYYTPTPPSQQDLARRLVVDKSAISGLLNRMERADLLKRRKDSKDKRRFEIVLTKKGRDAFEGLEAEYLGEVKQVMDSLDPAAINALNRSLEALRVSIETYFETKSTRE